MKKHYKILAILPVLAFWLYSCDDGDDPLPLPTVAFEVEPDFPEVGLPVTFRNNTVNAASYEWSFGNGETANIPNPSVTYNEAGDYTVKLTATTNDNQVVSDSAIVTAGQRVMTAFFINNFLLSSDI